MKKIVMKFGGTSVGSGENIRQVAKIIAEYVNQGYATVIVVSALQGVTDRLIEASKKAQKGNHDYLEKFRQEILREHLEATRKAVDNSLIQEENGQILHETIEDLLRILTGIVYVGELTPKSEDQILSFGERLSARILCGALQDIGLKAKYFTGKDAGIVTDSNFGEANPLMNVTEHQIRKRIEPLIDRGIIPVVTGYIAATQDGVTTTLGRGGSDYTATIIGAALRFDEVWIWTDVDGLMTSDPKIVPQARTISELSFQEATEMTIFGAKGMHPRALDPAMKTKIPVRIRNVNKRENSGTLILRKLKVKPETTQDVVKAVTLVRNVVLINVSGSGMVGAPGTAAKVFDILGKETINVLMISQSVSESNISFIIQRKMLEKAVNTLEIALLGRSLIREVAFEDDVCVVSVVGAGMKGTPGVASRIFTSIAKKGINVHMIAQGSSELNISFVVKEADGNAAVQAIHEEFELDKV